MRIATPIVILAALALAACNNSPDGDDTDTSTSRGGNAAAGMTETASGGPGASDDPFVTACLEASNNTSRMCECLSEKSSEDLTATGREFVIASMLNQEDRLMSMRAEMDGDEVIATSMFLVNASVQCAREGRQ